MIVYFTEEFSIEIENKFDFLVSYRNEMRDFFQHKSYGDDLEVLYICLFCMSPKFESFFKHRKPSYKSESSVYIHQGVQVEREGKSLTYELRLNYQKYLQSAEVRPLLALDVLSSLEVIRSVKKIKHFDLAAFRSDLERFFKLNGWLN